jgi:hypothetical protein
MADRPRSHGFLLETIVIVFSVLLALFLNEWRQSVARAETVNTVIETVRREAESNRAEVERALAHHRELVTQLRSGGIVMARFHMAEAGLDTTSEVRFTLSVNRLARAQASATGSPTPPAFRARRVEDGRWQLTSPELTAYMTIRGDSAILQGPGGITLRSPFLVDAAWETLQITQAAVHIDPEIVSALAAARQYQRHVERTVTQIVPMLYGASGSADMVSALADLTGFEAGLLQAYDRLLALLPPASAGDVAPGTPEGDEV